MGYVRGIIGGIIGALIATIPWVLVYVYGGYILSILAAVIAFGAFFGYKLLKGSMSKATPFIIGGISLVVVAVTTLVIIPLFMLHNEGFPVTYDNLMLLYDSSDFVGSLTKDLIVSIVFSVIGISGVFAKAKAEIEEVK